MKEFKKTYFVDNYRLEMIICSEQSLDTVIENHKNKLINNKLITEYTNDNKCILLNAKNINALLIEEL